MKLSMEDRTAGMLGTPAEAEGGAGVRVDEEFNVQILRKEFTFTWKLKRLESSVLDKWETGSHR